MVTNNLSPAGAPLSGDGGLPAPEKPVRKGAQSSTRPRRLGMRAALNRKRALLNGRTLPPEKEAMVSLTARVIVHLENVSNRIYFEGEFRRGDDEVRAAVDKTLSGLYNQVLEGLRYCFGDGDKESSW